MLLIFPPYLLIRYGHALSVNVEGQDTLHAHTHTDTHVCSTHMHTHDGAEDGDRDIGWTMGCDRGMMGLSTPSTP